MAKAIKELVEAPQNCRVIMTVIQDTNTSENSFLPLLYDYYAYTYNVVFANAAGNNISSSYPFDTPLTNPGAAYNGITTGGLITTSSTAVYDKIGSLSLAGPTADGRQKPDVCAPSPLQTAPAYSSDTAWATTPGSTQGYTSYAVPHTAGVAAVLLSYADSTAIVNDGRNEVIRAVIVNAAFANILDKAGNPTITPADADWPWQTDRGYGRLDALRAFETLSAPQITPGLLTSNHRGWRYDILSAGEVDSYPITGVVNERLVVTLTWNRRVALEDKNGPGKNVIQPGELTGYLANLSLEIRDPGGVVVSPVPSTVDNLEKVDLLLAKTGTYEIRIVNQSPSEYAGYGLAFEILPPLAGDVHVDYVVNTLDAVALAEHWLSSGCDNSAAACFAYNLSGNARIDLADFAVLAENWLATDARYYVP